MAMKDFIPKTDYGKWVDSYVCEGEVEDARKIYVLTDGSPVIMAPKLARIIARDGYEKACSVLFGKYGFWFSIDDKEPAEISPEDGDAVMMNAQFEPNAEGDEEDPTYEVVEGYGIAFTKPQKDWLYGDAPRFIYLCLEDNVDSYSNLKHMGSRHEWEYKVSDVMDGIYDVDPIPADQLNQPMNG
jgi:hypothetical protein